MGFPSVHQLTITKNDVSNLTDYQVKIDENSLSFSRIDFSKILPLGADIRFFSDLGLTVPLSYWIEAWDDTAETFTIWVKIPSDITTIYMAYGNAALSDASSGADTFDYFEGFSNTVSKLLAKGTDSGQSGAFSTTKRRVYVFNADNASGVFQNIVQWFDIDTGEVGFVFPGLNSLVNDAAWVWNPSTKLFYGYGGRPTVSTWTDIVQTFDPETEVFATLAATLPVAMQGCSAIYDPVTGDHFGFGGITATGIGTDMIWRHKVSTDGTLVDTTANIPVAGRVTAVHETETNMVYLVGGGIVAADTAHARIDTYDTSTDSTDPVASGVLLSEVKDSVACSHYSDGVNSFIYCFGGFSGVDDTYKNKVEKITVAAGTETIADVSGQTLGLADDDAMAFYDATTAKIWSGPWIHSTGITNMSPRKVVMRTFDPTSDTFDAEPSLAAVPTGWASVGDASTVYVKDPVAVGGDTMVISDVETGAFVRAEEIITAQTGVFFLEMEMSIPFWAAVSNNYQIIFGQNGSSAKAFAFRTNQTNTWGLFDASTFTAITTIPNGSWHWLGALVDQTNEDAYGEVNRANRTAAVWDDAGVTLDKIWVNSSTAGREHFLVRNMLIRKGIVGTEPTVNIGFEIAVGDAILFTNEAISKPSFANSLINKPSFDSESLFGNP